MSSTARAMESAKAVMRPLFRRVREWRVPRRRPRIVRVLPHDPAAYTQGLLYRGGWLYESSGGATNSTLRKLDPESGAVVQSVSLAGIWAEGIAAIDDTLVVLTWKEERAYVFSLPELKSAGTFGYRGEGWGLTARARTYLMTNGTNAIAVRDEQFAPVDVIQVRMNGLPVGRLNDIEAVGDRAYANVYYSTDILDISLATGQVRSIIDGAILQEIEQPVDADHVLNGIAYNHDTGNFFVTGKHWNRLFEVVWDASAGGRPW